MFLFLALLLNLRTIVNVPAYRAQAKETLGSLLSLLVLSLLLIPGQDRRLLGTELAAGSLVLLLIGVSLQLQSISRMERGRRLRWALRVVPLNLGTVAGFMAGVSLHALMHAQPVLLVLLLVGNASLFVASGVTLY